MAVEAASSNSLLVGDRPGEREELHQHHHLPVGGVSFFFFLLSPSLALSLLLSSVFINSVHTLKCLTRWAATLRERDFQPHTLEKWFHALASGEQYDAHAGCRRRGALTSRPWGLQGKKSSVRFLPRRGETPTADFGAGHKAWTEEETRPSKKVSRIATVEKKKKSKSVAASQLFKDGISVCTY